MFTRSCLALWLLCVPLPALAELPDDEPEREMRDRFFMPALELGVLFHVDPTIRPGVLFRTSVDWRFDRQNAGFLRGAYDATTARMVRKDADGEDRLVGNLSIHDLVAGIGGRVGPPDIQFVGSVQGGLQIGEVPILVTQPDDTLLVDLETRFAGIAIGAIGAEVYIQDDVAFTMESSLRWRSRPLAEDVSPWAVGFTLGVTSEL